jgi:hypothetical protein
MGELTFMNIDGTTCIVFEGMRLDPEFDRPPDFPYIYYARHSEFDWSVPSTLEEGFVVVNFWGTVYSPKKFNLDGGSYDIKDTFI